MKIVAEVFKLASGSPIPQLYGLRDDGTIDRYATDTLLDLISESRPEELKKLDELLTRVQAGDYQQVDSALPDWSSNDKNVWMSTPYAPIGVIVVSNENIPELASDEGQPQQFLISSAKGAISHWLQFLHKLSSFGAESLVGKKFEVIV